MLSELATGNNRSGPASSLVQLFAARQARIARREMARASHESPHTNALHPVRHDARRHGARHALLSHVRVVSYELVISELFSTVGPPLKGRF